MTDKESTPFTAEPAPVPEADMPLPEAEASPTLPERTGGSDAFASSGPAEGGVARADASVPSGVDSVEANPAGEGGAVPIAAESGVTSMPDHGKATAQQSSHRRISFSFSASLTLLALLLLSVIFVSWYGMKRFTATMDDLSHNALPQIMLSSSSTENTSRLLVLFERFVNSSTDAEFVLASKEISKLLDDLDSVYSQQAIFSEQAVNYLAVLRAHFNKVSELVVDRLELEETLFQHASALEQVITRSTYLMYYTGETGQPSDMQRILPAVSRLVFLATNVRTDLLSPTMINPHKMKREIIKIFAEIETLFPGPEQMDNAEIRSRWQALIQYTKERLLVEKGVAESVYSLMRIKNKSTSMNNSARSIMVDLAATQLSSFNNLVRSTTDNAYQASREIGQFTDVFVLIGSLALLVSLGVYVYFRSAFILRIEALNEAVLARVRGEQSKIDTHGDDEIATIAKSVNHFAVETARSMALAEASNKAKGDFLANMSHEIRTPLNGIVGFTRMVGETSLTDRQRDMVGKIEASTRFLSTIINDILDFSKIEAGKLAIERIPFNLHKIVDNVVAVAQPKAKNKKLDFTLNVADNVPEFAVGDPLRIFQILNNLSDNAVKFTILGGVTINISVEEAGEKDNRIRFEVIDKGIGLTSEQAGKLFTPFTQADSSTTRHFGGTGLGLAICKSLCELMGGSIAVDSEYGKGSCFYFILPLGMAVAKDLAQHANPGDDVPPSLEGKVILLAEDNVINQEIALSLLEKTKARIKVVDNGQEAVNAVQKEQFDFILMDIQMPVMDGLVAARTIRDLSVGKTVPIIAMTANAMEEDREKTRNAGMNGHVAKPIDVAELFSALRHWM